METIGVEVADQAGECRLAVMGDEILEPEEALAVGGVFGRVVAVELGDEVDCHRERIDERALGVPGAQHWVNDLPNETNKKYVSGYIAKYKSRPSFYGSQSYDAANFINSAVVAVKGDLTKKDAMRDEMRKANYKSVRGPYRYGNNHFPIQNFYLQDVVKNAEGDLVLKTVATIVKDSQDKHHDKCPMKW